MILCVIFLQNPNFFTPPDHCPLASGVVRASCIYIHPSSIFFAICKRQFLYKCHLFGVESDVVRVLRIISKRWVGNLLGGSFKQILLLQLPCQSEHCHNILHVANVYTLWVVCAFASNQQHQCPTFIKLCVLALSLVIVGFLSDIWTLYVWYPWWRWFPSVGTSMTFYSRFVQRFPVRNTTRLLWRAGQLIFRGDECTDHWCLAFLRTWFSTLPNKPSFAQCPIHSSFRTCSISYE